MQDGKIKSCRAEQKWSTNLLRRSTRYVDEWLDELSELTELRHFFGERELEVGFSRAKMGAKKVFRFEEVKIKMVVKFPFGESIFILPPIWFIQFEVGIFHLRDSFFKSLLRLMHKLKNIYRTIGSYASLLLLFRRRRFNIRP